ncbi:MAG TPA: DedA family protein [Fimbriimonas sp.]
MPLIDFILHIDQHLKEIIANYGTQTYLILFAIVFAETGLVVTPFLPGDSLLFAAGIFAHPGQGPLSLPMLYLTFVGAALLGDNVNYQIGKRLGRRLFERENSKFFKRDHLAKTEHYFHRYGGLTIIIARFVPIVRTFAPFVAGMGAMSYLRFLLFCVIGAVLWVGVCVTAGYFFGAIPFVRENFSVAVLAVIGISVVPAVIEAVRHRAKAKKRMRAPEGERHSAAP